MNKKDKITLAALLLALLGLGLITISMEEPEWHEAPCHEAQVSAGAYVCR